ncbi:T9SS type A sorting domain-containing protein [uncultured Hymenobacter sp.]|uniref:T9SS type A sorting domain-containing protein n=1 Tax=uncultured Hymenobacter sp. TaxID=170016 RepID=UPI0035CBA34E
MPKIVLLTAAVWLSLGAALAQRLPGVELRPARPVVCPARPENMFTRQAPPQAFLHPKASRRGQAASITVTYTDFTPEAQAAFQYAVNIWQSQLNSAVPIHVDAQWTSLGRGVLGSAGTTTVARNFSGAPQANVWYPIALAEKIAGQDLNGPGQAEISANFSSEANWYYGTDGQTPRGKYDLVTVVLHELCHGLGFVASAGYDPDTSNGDYGYGFDTGTGPALPFTFDTFIETADGRRLTDAGIFPNPGTALGTEFIGGQLFFDSPLAAAVNPAPGDKRPRLYSPDPYSNGSSISHLDEEAYPAGTPFSLMTYAVGAAEAIHDPGELTRKMFDEMGWFVTAIRHAPQLDIETPRAVTVTASVESDGTVTPGSVRLSYSINNAAFTTVAMTPSGPAGQYQGTIPNPGTNATVRYYLSASDNETRRIYTAPGQPAPGISARQTYQYVIGPDVTEPQAAHTPPPYLFDTDLPFQVVVQAADNLGVASVTVPYSINGRARTPLTLARQADGITYVGTISSAGGPIVAGDELSYSVVVTDQAARANRTTLGPFTVPIVGLKAPQNQYVNDFNAPTSDFVGVGFSVAQPAGFTDPAIHSEHPYPDQADLTYQLLVPIVVRSEVGQDTVKFNEVVLVEPGEEDSEFGSVSFYDYVVVEGSLDGQTWTPLADGYDSRANPRWLAAYNGTTSGDNSTAVGTPALYAKRTFNLRDKFKAGDVVQLRFRLFADEAAHGWGWAIDNLSIQRLSLADQLAVNELSVYPNPTSASQVQVIAKLARTTSGLELRVRNVLGQEVRRQALAGAASQLDLPLDVSGLRPGLYFVSLFAGGKTITTKLIIQ